MPFATPPPPSHEQRVPYFHGMHASLLWKGRCEASKEEETWQNRLLPLLSPPSDEETNGYCHPGGAGKGSSRSRRLCLRTACLSADDKGHFHALRLSLSPPLTLNLCPPSCPLLAVLAVMLNLPHL